MIVDFIRESNAIEDIFRKPTEVEKDLLISLMSSDLNLEDVLEFQTFTAPGFPIRDKAGMGVRVGGHIAPPGGPSIVPRLDMILQAVRGNIFSPWKAHCEFLTLHPFMDGNGRTSRAVWAWHMRRSGEDPFAIPFLQRFYYQTLENADGR